jgi:hypothetical protein
MEWSTPTFEEIPMNAEIGGYYGDDEVPPAPPISSESSAEARAS